MLKVTLKQLRYFVTVAEHQSISAAARKLHISQPAVTVSYTHLTLPTNREV